MSGGRSEFSIDDAFELSLEEGGPGAGGAPARFGALHFERKSEEGEKQSRLKYQNLENDEDGPRIPSDPDGAPKIRLGLPPPPAPPPAPGRRPPAQCGLSQQGLRPLLHPQLPVVLQHHQQRHPALLPGLLQLDPAPSDPEESPGGSGLLSAAVVGPHTHPHRDRTAGEPFSRRLQCHLPCPWLPAAHSWSLPRHLHLLRCQGPPRFPVFLLALL